MGAGIMRAVIGEASGSEDVMDGVRREDKGRARRLKEGQSSMSCTISYNESSRHSRTQFSTGSLIQR